MAGFRLPSALGDGAATWGVCALGTGTLLRKATCAVQ